MITSKSEYLFVSGSDMDLITIDGSIMPLRSGNTASGQPFAKVLRGEDVAFLMEAWAERRDLNVLSPNAWTFHRTVGTDLPGLLSNMLSDAEYTCFDSVPSDVYDVASDYFTTWSAAHTYTAARIGIAADSFDRGKKLEQAKMSAMFAAIRSMSIVWCERVTTQSAGGSSILETYDMDADFPYVATSDTGYRSYGGREVTDDDGVVHPNAYGGYQIRLGSWRYSDTNAAMRTTPAKIEMFGDETYEKTDTDGTATKCQLTKFGEATITSGLGSFEDTASARKARLLAAMTRYWSMSPGFVSAGETVKVEPTTWFIYDFATVGSHTKWW